LVGYFVTWLCLSLVRFSFAGFFFCLPSFSRHITVMLLGRKKDGASIIRVVPIWQMLASSQTTKQSVRTEA